MNRILGMMLLSCIAVACGACNLRQPFPDQRLYALNAGEASATATNTTGEPQVALRVRPVGVSAPFNNVFFMYKIGESRFESDYFNAFVASPGRLMTGEIVRRLSTSGVFSTVSDGGSLAPAPLTLEMNVTALYGDYTNASSPVAVIEARVFLLDDGPNSTTIRLQKNYSAREPAADKSPDALVAAWGRALGKIIDELTVDLRSSGTIAEAR